MNTGKDPAGPDPDRRSPIIAALSLLAAVLVLGLIFYNLLANEQSPINTTRSDLPTLTTGNTRQ